MTEPLQRSKLPPTERQIERISEFIDHVAIAPHLDSVMKDFDRKIRTRGGAGVLLGWMKAEIDKWEKAKVR